jgi:hypothetical protein
VGQPEGRHSGLPQRQYRPRVDRRRLQQLFPEGTSERLDVLVEATSGPLEQGPARERQPVRVDAGGGDAHEHVARGHGVTAQDGARVECTDRRTHEIEGRGILVTDDVGELGKLTSDDGNARRLGRGSKAAHDRLGSPGIELGHGQVVDHRRGTRPHAHEVVHVHGYAVESDGVVALEHRGDQRL